jgi:hypothetical protein
MPIVNKYVFANLLYVLLLAEISVLPCAAYTKGPHTISLEKNRADKTAKYEVENNSAFISDIFNDQANDPQPDNDKWL